MCESFFFFVGIIYANLDFFFLQEIVVMELTYFAYENYMLSHDV